MRYFDFFSKTYYHVKKTKFMKDFAIFDRSSGVSKDCVFIGKEHMRVGANCYFGPGCEVIAYNSHLGNKLNASLTMGHDVRITKTCRITCAGNIKIGDNVLMGPDVMITDHNHGMDPTYPGGYSPQPLIVKNVTIKDGCWIGQRACILPGVTVGAHSIIGAGSVVTHDIPDFCIVCGVPARVIKKHNGDTGVWEAE